MLFRGRSLRLPGHDQAAAMIPDECPPAHQESEASIPSLQPANDNGSDAAVPVDPRILTIARAIGRSIARQQLKALQVANENERLERR